MLETKLENETHSEPDINILTTLLIKEKGKDKPGCQKQNVVHFQLKRVFYFKIKISIVHYLLNQTLTISFQIKTKESPLHVEDTIMPMIIETSWYLDMNDELKETISKFHNNQKIPIMSYFVKNTGNRLDEKQTVAYEII